MKIPITSAAPMPFNVNNDYSVKLDNYIKYVEKTLESGSWTEEDFAHLDVEFMPGLVASANMSKPGLKLTYVNNANELSEKVLEAFLKVSESERFIVNIGDDGTHFAVVDYRLVEGKPSVLMFEPVTFLSTGAQILALRVRLALDKLSSHNICFSIMEMGIQSSKSECGLFSLALAKKLFKEHHAISEIHQKNVEMVEHTIPLTNGFFSSEESDALLPPFLYKHTQGRGRLERYINAGPGRDTQKVNKKGDTLLQRQKQHLENVNGEQKVNSIHHKRRDELKKLALSVRQQLKLES